MYHNFRNIFRWTCIPNHKSIPVIYTEKIHMRDVSFIGFAVIRVLKTLLYVSTNSLWGRHIEAPCFTDADTEGGDIACLCHTAASDTGSSKSDILITVTMLCSASHVLASFSFIQSVPRDQSGYRTSGCQQVASVTVLLPARPWQWVLLCQQCFPVWNSREASVGPGISMKSRTLLGFLPESLLHLWGLAGMPVLLPMGLSSEHPGKEHGPSWPFRKAWGLTWERCC